MSPRILISGVAAILTIITYASAAYALTENELVRLHQLCMSGDRDACAHRNAAIHDHDHEAEWRVHHPEWYR